MTLNIQNMNALKLASETKKKSAEAEWMKWVIDADVIDLVAKHASREYRTIGRLLLRSNEALLKTKSALTNKGNKDYKNDSDRLREILARWEDKKKDDQASVDAQLTELQEACVKADIWGIVEIEVGEISDTDERLKKMIEVVVEEGGLKYSHFGRTLLHKTGSKLDQMLGVPLVNDREIMMNVLEDWRTKEGTKATVQELLEACQKADVGGVIRDSIKDLAQKREEEEGLR
eukprot:m.148077 g.148077  ORF g.148077 m.148077 type:complete len:232 (+) comp38490_c0_seq1:10-705(+)